MFLMIVSKPGLKIPYIHCLILTPSPEPPVIIGPWASRDTPKDTRHPSKIAGFREGRLGGGGEAKHQVQIPAHGKVYGEP